MKYILTYLTLALCLCSCDKGVKFKIDGTLADNAASEVYLVVENSALDTLATATVQRDNTFQLRGTVEEPTTAFVCDDNGNALTILLIEENRLYIKPLAEGGYQAEGGPINDKYNIIMRRLSDVARQISEISPEDESPEEAYESLIFKYQDILSAGVSSNLDNIIGVELFLSQESRSMTAEDMRIRMKQFSPKMRRLSAMVRFEEYIELYAKTEIGQPFLDAPLRTMAGRSSLSKICGQGKWVLLDFWASWCEPCCEEIPLLRELYSKYALKGFEICSISLDRDPQRWRTFVMQNQMLWTNALDLPREGETAVVEMYGLQSIPANFLISPDGKIVARNLHGEDLRHELEHRLGH